jgi:hypothetical protein
MPSKCPPVGAVAKADVSAPWVKQVEQTSPEWTDPASYALLPPNGYWAVDQLEALSARAFGVLPPELDVQQPRIQTYMLNTDLPRAPSEAEVYLVGQYPPEWSAVIDRLNTDESGWSSIPQLSYLGYEGARPLGESTTITDAQHAQEHAIEVLNNMLMSDSRALTTTPQPDGTWLVTFIRYVEGKPLYSDRPLRAWVNQSGQVTQIQGRRRPLLRKSMYPLRSSQEAWTLLEQGCGIAIPLPGQADIPSKTERFVVENIELAYIERHVHRPQDIWQPYFVFRDDQGAMIVIPAVADPHVEWPQLKE